MPSSTVLCFTCDKARGTCKCEGCSKKFCESHFFDHRRELKQTLDVVTDEHNNFHNILTDNENLLKPLYNQIDSWEKKAIKQIQRAALEARQSIETMTSELKSKLSQGTYEMNLSCYFD